MSKSPGKTASLRAPYPTVSAQPHFPEIEKASLDYWKENKTFARSLEIRQGAEEYVFYDGPPFANGLPHYGHLLTSFIKDTVGRYQTMCGHLVNRRFGWDCHGLPVEMEVERQLGISGKAAIGDFGIANFNEHCRESVMKYTDEWERTVTRCARWVDFENDYKTMDIDYMESVIWAFKRLHEKGLIYEGKRVLPYCWECETPLSNFETRMDDAYRDRDDVALTVTFPLPELSWKANNEDDFAGTYHLLAWTTTPWTLPSNFAVAVGDDITYAVYEEDGNRYILGEATVGAYKSQLKAATRVGTLQGSALVGQHYTPLFPYFATNRNAFVVRSGSFVTTEEGTGVVHLAPYGEDDWALLNGFDVEIATPVTLQGVFTEEVPDFADQHVFEANVGIAEHLKAAKRLVKREKYTHSYPHCWRSDTPLLYMPVSSWFVEVTKIKDRLVAANQEIHWIPEHVKDGAFGKWLEGARDWSISRNRFWGAPIPVWVSDDPRYPRVDVYGSLAELEADFGVRPTDLHRPTIDQLTRPNPDDPTGASTMRRVPDVLDCWFESGSMPFAQVHYPFENKDWFDSHYPGDFIVEYVAQTRGWFYTLHVLAVALFDHPSFRTCLTHGVVLGEDGRKASKRLRNYPDPEEVFATVGADSCRFALYASPVIRGGDVPVGRKMLTEVGRHVLVPLWNAWYFLSIYGNADGIRGTIRTNQTGVLDRYLLAKTAELRDDMTKSLDEIDLYEASGHLLEFIEVLNNWWIRRSRDRFWRPNADVSDADKQDAYDTLHTVLVMVCRLGAPILPLFTEHLFRSLTEEESVHLTDWVGEDELPHDPALVEAMDFVREVCSEVLSIRKSVGLRVRLPLAEVVIAAPHVDQLKPFLDLIADEVNVKRVTLRTDPGALGHFQLAVDPGKVGPRLGGAVQSVLKAAREGAWTSVDDSVELAGHRLLPEEFSLRFTPKHAERARTIARNTGVLELHTELTPELLAEGLARDVVRAIQAARRDENLAMTDRISIQLSASPETLAAVQSHLAYVKAQTLCQSLTFADNTEAHVAEMVENDGAHVAEVEGDEVRFILTKK